jgi:hypothetical protein
MNHRIMKTNHKTLKTLQPTNKLNKICLSFHKYKN